MLEGKFIIQEVNYLFMKKGLSDWSYYRAVYCEKYIWAEKSMRWHSLILLIGFPPFII